MPIYEYKCDSCGHRMEAIQKMSDPVLKECPSCNESALVKLMSAGSFQMKGPSGRSGGCGSESSPACAACPAARG